VTFRALTRDTVERYVARESSFDCVGGFKAEGLGIARFSRTAGDVPTALIALPLIRLAPSWPPRESTYRS
jgi:predicted house-cleaning NTP pyrophosphatase (Maf/HAM1 superfamily)